MAGSPSSRAAVAAGPAWFASDAADVWSLASLGLTLLLGRSPFRFETAPPGQAASDPQMSFGSDDDLDGSHSASLPSLACPSQAATAASMQLYADLEAAWALEDDGLAHTSAQAAVSRAVESGGSSLSGSAAHFFASLLHPEPARRPTAASACRHPWIAGLLVEAVLHTLPSLASPRKTSSRLWRRLPQLVRAGDVLPRSEEVAKGVYRDYERDGKEYKDACTEARYFRPGKDCIVGKEADLHFDRVKKRYQLAHVWRSCDTRIVKGLEELRDEIEELALEAMMELGSDDESSDGMKAAATLVDEFIRACKGARYLAAATGFEGFLPGILERMADPAAPIAEERGFQDLRDAFERRIEGLRDAIERARLFCAAWTGCDAVVRQLVEAGVGVNEAMTSDGATPLLAACQNGHDAVVRMLVEAGADVNKATTSDGATPLYIACQNGHDAVVRLLVEAGADVNQARTSDGATPLYMACRNGHDAVVRLLVAAGADVNKAKTDTGATPLLVACRNGHDAVARLLVEAGADVNKATTSDGATPLYIACQNGHDAVAWQLVEAGADVNKATTSDGATPLYIACRNGHDAVARQLVEAGADVNKATTSDGATPLYIACQNGHDAVAWQLVAAGADVNEARTSDGATPLYMACRNGHDAVARQLVEAGVDSGASASAGLAMLQHSGHTDVIEALMTPTTWERRLQLLAWRTSVQRRMREGACAAAVATHERVPSGECAVMSLLGDWKGTDGAE
ncbi:hypothetical protein FNF31_04833 [Cafeteria roenbergensis]|uniref:Protein kinase domain-containing protein n=1 Tax=Cafeteria roenbergensis TaxID=33653 RepID=A0A5A8D4E9_CAFRO|nr:hypothetical protein FNF31_04833 [Cafeteria roenbergensis]